MDSESSAGVHRPEEYMAYHGSSQSYQSSASSSEGVEYTPLKEDPPPSLLPTWLMVMGFILVCFWVWRAANRYLENYKRRQAVLERRRRAGIPDEDTRPFEIAYAEAALRRREQDEERRRKEKEQVEASQQQDSDWSRLGRTMTHPQDSRYEAGHSPPHPPPPVWQDQYAPPEIRAQHDRQRELAAVATASSLGRRSRKHLFLDGDSNSEADIPSRVRRRTDQWGTMEAIDGDNNARWATSNVFGQGQVQRRIRKRDAEGDSDIENEDPRAKSKRKVDTELPSIPGQFKSPTSDQTIHASVASGPGKRKAREDEEATEIDDGKGQQLSTKQKKRVRVLSYHESKQGSAEPADEEMMEGEDEQDLALEPLRQPGEEWTADGKKYKMDEDGVVRIQGYVKEETSTVHPGRFSPKRSIKTAIRAKWLSLEEYADAENSGTLVPGVQEEYISIEQHPLSRAGSEAPSDWSAAVGQTPLKTGGMKTGLGSDRHPPPFASLPHAGNLPVEQHRLLHLASPARKGMMLGGKALRPMGSQSQWERKQAEVKAMEALREARRKAKAEATPAGLKPAATVAALGEASKPVQATVAPSASLPTFTLTSTQTTTTGQPKLPAFTLPGAAGSTSAEQKKDEDKKAEAPKTVRFSFGPAGATTTTTAPTPTAANAAGTTSTTTARPAATASTPSLFPASTTTATPSTTAPASALFGNFGQTKAEDKKPEAPASSGLSFKLPGSTSSTASADKPALSFGGGSLFGAPAPTSSTTTAPSATAPAAPSTAPAVPTSSKPSEPPKLSFGFGPTRGGTGPAPLFGAQAASTTSAAPATSAPTNIFGSTQPSTAADDASKRPGATPLQPSTSNGMFGSTAPTQPSGVLFGGAPTGGFGTSATSGFGSTAPKPDASTTKPTFSFGAAATTPSTNGFTGFGANANKPADSTAADKPAAGGGLSILGAAQKGPQNSAPSGFGASSVFGSQGGSTPTTSAFGQTGNSASHTTPAFGQTSAAGSSAPSNSAFGQPASTTPSFGQQSHTPSAFGQPASATAPSFSFGQPAATPTASTFGATTPAATNTTFGQNAPTSAATTPSASTFGANGPNSAFGNAAGSSKPSGFSFSFGGGNAPGFGGGSGANSAPGTPVPTSAVAPTFTFGAGTSKPGDGTTSPRATPSTPGGRAFKPLPRPRR
ncbi:hypothetical protein FRC05_000328 [Tulasnella sp. 425]|nr:hypothetical protein FRC05_000328 [Tulasnella sp. 425]